MFTPEFLLTKQRPNFMPSSVISQQKKMEKEKEDIKIKEEIERDMQVDEREEQIIRKARTTPSISIPKPASMLDEDDDSFGDNN